MIEIRRKVKAKKNHHLRKMYVKIEQNIAFDYFNYNMTPTELGKHYNLDPKTIISMLSKWEIIPKVKRIPITVTKEQLEQMRFLKIGFELFDKDTEIIQYKESKINN